MIEPDINERMARFAPSQNMGDPGDDAIERAVAGMAGVPARPKFEQDADIDAAVLQIAGERRQDMAASLMAASQVNPDQAARASKLGEQFGVGQDIALRNMQELEREAAVRDILRMDLMRNDPVLARYLADRAFASEARDDVGTLAKVKGIIGGIAEIPQSVSEGFRRGIATYELAELIERQRQRGGKIDVLEQAAINSINEEIALLGQESGFWESAATIVTLNLAQAPEYVEPIVTGGVVGGVTGATLGLGGGPVSPATVPAGMLTGIGLGLKAGAVTGAFEASRRLETALLYGQALEEGLDHDAANKVALAGGAVSGLLELVGVGVAGKAYSLAVKQVVRRSMNEALKNRTKAAVLKEVGILYVGGGLGETATEVSQEIVNQTAIEAGKFMRDKPMIFDDPQAMQEFGDRLVDTAIETAQGMAIIGVPGAGIQLYSGVRRAAKAEQQQQVILGLVENRKESGLAKRNEVAYERFLAGQTNGTPAETIYIDGTAAQQVLAQSGVSTAQLEEILPGIRERISEAVHTGGDVTIPTALFGARLANTDLGTAMLPHVRLSPDAMSMTEAQEFATRRQEVVREAEQILAQKQEADATFVQQARQIEDTLASQIVATGQMDEKAARSSAQFMRDFYVTQAAALGMSPQQVYERFPVRVEGAMPAVAAPLEQADQFDQAGQRRTDTPEFKAWSNNAPIVQGEATEFATRQPFAGKAYHGSPVTDITEFDPFAPSRFRKELERGMGAIWFGAEPATATNFAGMAGSVYPVYVTLQNPLVIDAAKEAQPDLYVRLQGGQTIYDIQYIKAAAIARAKRDGHDGVVFVNAYDGAPVGGKATIYAIFNPTDIKSVNNRGTWSRTAANIMEQAATMDAEYLAAVERGDMETAQRMVDEATAVTGYTESGMHGLSRGKLVGNQFDPKLLGSNTGAASAKLGFFFGSKATAATYAFDIDPVAARKHSKKLQSLWKQLTDKIPEQYRYLLTGSMQIESDRGPDAFFPTADPDQTGEQVAFDAEEYYGRLGDGAMFAQEDIMGIADLMSAKDGQRLNEYVENKWIPMWMSALDVAMSEVQSTDASILNVKLKMQNPLVFDFKGSRYRDVSYAQIISRAKEQNHDSVILKNTYDGGGLDDIKIVFSPEQIKSADPVTYDEAGNVIPLSRRFDITSPRIFEQAAVPERELGPIEAAKRLVQETGREAFTDADEFFKKRWNDLLKETKRQVKPTPRNFREAAKRAVADILDFVKNNPKFADYYANDWKVTRSILDDYIGRAITDDEFAMFRTIAGLTSPNTMLPANISDTVGLWDHWMREGNFDAFTLGPKPGTGALVVFEAAEPISGTTANVKVRTIRIIERLIKERGGVTQALEYLQEGVPVKELHKFNRKMGYAGAVGDIGNITDLVQQATGQSELIPRMFIFGQKVGAYTLNAIGDERYTTVDIWESRYIRSHFTGMFDINIGLPESTDEHQIFTRFGDLFKEEMEAVTGRKWAPSALQALRWFYIIGSAREAGYSKASTNETISFYTERRLVQAFGYPGRAATGGGPGVGTTAPGGATGQVRAARIPPKRFERDLESDVAKLPDPADRRRAIAAGYVRYARYNSELGQRGFSFDERRGGPARQHGTLNATVAADFVPGERLKAAFGKANLPIQTIQELVADDAGATAFQSLVAATNSSTQYGAAVAVYQAADYQGKRLFVTEDGTAGFALTSDGDIVSVFSANKSGNGRALMMAAVQAGGRRLDCFDTALPGYYAAHGFKAVARIAWNDEYAPPGWNMETFKAFNNGRPDVVFMVYEGGYNGEYKAGAGEKVKTYDDGVQSQTTALQAIAKSQVFEQAARGPARGGFDPKRLTTILNKTADLSTFLHESAHAFLTFYEQVAATPDAPARIVSDMDELLRWFKIDGATPAERIANWNGLTLDQKRKYHETFAYNFEVYLFDGKAPSVEMQGLFERFSAWLKRVYRSIRDDLNAIYRREFGEDLPILTGEVRQVMDRMLATDEQIKRQAAINEMKPQFQTQEQSGMDDAEWAAYQAMQQEAIEASVTDMNKASMRQLQWLGNARSRILRDMQKKHDAKRKEVAAEVAAELRVEPVYRAMTYLRTGKFIDSDGAEVTVEGPHRLDTKRTQAIYAGLPTEKDMEAVRATGMAMPKVFAPDIAKLGTGKYGMLGVDGLDPDVVAETFGFGSGDQMIRALLAAKPIKEAVAERTDAEMLRRFGDMNTPEAQEAEVQKALHNEARARFVAVELRHVARATEPVRVMLEAAKQVARELIAGMTLREVRPADFIAAEARAARDAGRMGTTVNPEAVGRAAYTRTYNERIAAGADEATAVAEATTAATEAARKAQERSDALKAQYGADPQQALIRAKRAQLYQNQLAAEALRVREEVAKQVKYLRRILRDTNVKAMGAQAADQIAGLLERFEVAPVSLKRLDERKALAAWLAEQEAAGLVPDIAPEVADEARRVNYQQLTVAEFRDLVDAIRQIEFIGKNERKVQLAAERAAYEEKRDEIVTRIRAVGRLRGVKFDPRSPLTNIGRSAAALRGFAAQHLKAASVARILDGGEDDGPLWTFAIRSANAAADMETRMRAEASAKLAEILAPVFALGNMGGKGVFFPSINRSLNREARLAIAMNVGNDGNRQRLLDGEGWTMEQVQPVLESLTEAEWQAVQKVWDYIDTYRPLIAEKERRLYGKEPEWVKPTPFTTRTADGREVRLEGGYYPIKYDPIASDRVATVDEAAEAKRALDGAYTAATTRRSFVKSRVREVVGRPLLYTLDAAFGGVNDVIHDLAWHEWLIQTQRLLRDPEFANAVRETRGPEFLKQLRDWAKDNAAGERKIGVAGEAALSWLRQGISASGLGFNVVSAAMQVTGFNQSIVRLGAKYVGRGVAQFAASPIDTARMVADKSSFMAERGRTQFREINEIRNRVRGQTEVARRVTAGTYFLMMNMQRTVDIPTWLAGYQKALDAGKDDATAVALADQAVRDTQGSGLISDLAAIERGGPVMKLFTVFYSYMNTVYNMTAVQTMTARSKGKLAADYAMLLVVPVVLGQAIKNLIQPDAGDDELDPEALARKLAAEELSFLMGTMVIAREFGGAAQLLTGAEGVRMGYGGPAGLRAVGEVYGLATQAGQLEFDRAFRRSAINTLGAFTGLPSAQVNRTIDGIEAVIEGEVEGVGAVVAPLTGVQR